MQNCFTSYWEFVIAAWFLSYAKLWRESRKREKLFCIRQNLNQTLWRLRWRVMRCLDFLCFTPIFSSYNICKGFRKQTKSNIFLGFLPPTCPNVKLKWGCIWWIAKNNRALNGGSDQWWVNDNGFGSYQTWSIALFEIDMMSINISWDNNRDDGCNILGWLSWGWQIANVVYNLKL